MTKKKEPRQGSSKAPPLTEEELHSYPHGRTFKMEEFLGKDFQTGYTPTVISQPGEWITIPENCEIVAYHGNTSPELKKGRIFVIREHPMVEEMKELKIRDRVMGETITEMKKVYRALEDKHEELLNSLTRKPLKAKKAHDIKNR
jgi:hypothetical protein